jgi:hypothetical protein
MLSAFFEVSIMCLNYSNRLKEEQKILCGLQNVHLIDVWTHVSATEIRCEEKTKGGLSYEVILADPVAVTPPKRPSSPSNKASVNIDEKLKAAKERRLVIVHSISSRKIKICNTVISQTSPVHTTPSYLYKIRLIVIYPPTSWSS